ncbi:MAG: alpha/beta hydrolase [Phenylobacterium sp.]|nr:MAG: alpha/beta hydrolase [Phenylobacterium sp.]
MTALSAAAQTLFAESGENSYAYRRFGPRSALPLICLQHFTGTLDNWDPAVVDVLAGTRDVVLFENAGIGRSNGAPASSVEDMTRHLRNFLETLGIEVCDVLGYSLGGMIAQQLALEQPSSLHRLVLVGTAPRGGEDIMHLDKPTLAPHFANPDLDGFARLQKIFFAPTASSQAAGAAFVKRLETRTQDREPAAGGDVAKAQIAAFRAWETGGANRFADLKKIGHPTFVVNGVRDEMIPIRNSYWLAENLPNAVLMALPDSAHGSLFQFHQPFCRQVEAFLSSTSDSAAF